MHLNQKVKQNINLNWERPQTLSKKEYVGFNFHNIDTVVGHCHHCDEETILVAIVTEFYRCTNCGADTKQHINGKISYIELTESDKEYIKNNGKKI